MRILVANNGLAALKFCTSIKKSGRSGDVHLVGIVTAADLANNAHFIRFVDGLQLVESDIVFSQISDLISIAEKHNCDSVYPGWGRISESPEFARAVRQAGLIFIGPPPEAMEVLGDKARATALAENCGLQILPWSGVDGIKSPEQAVRECERMGFPCVVKISVSGGGRGVRRVDNAAQAAAAFSEMREASDACIFAMKLAENMRHVEFQVVGDEHGNFKILGSRDCSVQRRQQKLVEESPPPDLDAECFSSTAAKVEAMIRRVGYTNVGTVEFLFDRESLYFLEVNCRLQVEHCVTEQLLDLNLPELQVKIAQGYSIEKISCLPESPRHVIAARILAETPGSFRPASGLVMSIYCPEGYFSVPCEGGRISVTDDSQIGHVVVQAETREAAIDRLALALKNLCCTGEVPLEAYCKFVVDKVLTSPDFRSAIHHTQWLELFDHPDQEVCSHCLVVAVALVGEKAIREEEEQFFREIRRGVLDAALPVEDFRFDAVVNRDSSLRELTVRKFLDGRLVVTAGGKPVSVVRAAKGANGNFLISFNGRNESQVFSVAEVADGFSVSRKGNSVTVAQNFQGICAPMSGKVKRWLVKEGAAFNPETVLYEIESMKVTFPIQAGCIGVIDEIKQRGNVTVGQVLATVAESRDFHEIHLDEFPTDLFQPALSLANLISSETAEFDPRGDPERWLRKMRLRRYVADQGPAALYRASRDELEVLANDSAFTQSELFSEFSMRAALAVADKIEVEIVNAILKDALSVRLADLAALGRIFDNKRLMHWLVRSTVQRVYSPGRFLQLKPWVEILDGDATDDEESAQLRHKAFKAGGPFVDDVVGLVRKALEAHAGDLAHVRQLPSKNCGVRAWEYQARFGRQKISFILAANDILYKQGSFGVEEAAAFVHAADEAIKNNWPLLFLQCNTGARFGLSEELADIAVVSSVGEEMQVRFPDTGEVSGLLSGDLNQENLAAAARMARAMVEANTNGFTASFVAGKAVGIGAYLARLGSRIIQRADSCLLLTGNKALNRLLGKEAYTDNNSLGGVGVMASNGVTSVIVEDDLSGISEILRWMLFSSLPNIVSVDPIPRQVSAEITSVFDKDSFCEYQSGASPSLTVGRARLAGRSVGVIFGKTGIHHELVRIADSADSSTSMQLRETSGGILYPRTASKFAQALRDFRGESMPAFIFANFRGFSGGRRDMHEGILQFGSMIVEELAKHHLPVFVYIPPGGELRGGSWVVMDKGINPAQIEIYADPTARGGVMEPEGVVEVKFKSRHLNRWRERSGIRDEQKLRQAALQFADLHDTPERMLRVGVIDGIVPFRDTRRFFAERLVDRGLL